MEALKKLLDTKPAKVIKWMFTVYTFIALFLELSISMSLNVWTSFPSGMCLPLFTKAEKVLPKLSTNSKLQYYFNGGQALALFCTSDTKSTVDSYFDGAGSYYSSSKMLGGCDMTNVNDYNYLLKHCKTRDTSASCASIVSTLPTYSGFIWKYGVFVDDQTSMDDFGDDCSFDTIKFQGLTKQVC